MNHRDIVDAIARNTIGKPAAVCSWQDMVRVRDIVDELLNRAVDELQVSAFTSRPAVHGHDSGSPNRRATSGDSFAAETRPAPNAVRRHVPPCVAPDGHHSPTTPPRAAEEA